MLTFIAGSLVSSAGQTALTENASAGDTGSSAAKEDVLNKMSTVINILDKFS